MGKPKITDEELKRLREKWEHSGFPEMIALIDEVEELRAKFISISAFPEDVKADIDKLLIGQMEAKIKQQQAIIDRMWPCAKEVTVTSTTSSTRSFRVPLGTPWWK
jgi:hypothetical protein